MGADPQLAGKRDRITVEILGTLEIGDTGFRAMKALFWRRRICDSTEADGWRDCRIAAEGHRSSAFGAKFARLSRIMGGRHSGPAEDSGRDFGCGIQWIRERAAAPSLCFLAMVWMFCA